MSGLAAIAVVAPMLLPFVGFSSNSAGTNAPTSQTQSVLVVNPGTQPVPVSGSLQAQQNGPWNVGINGTPTVALASGTNVSVNGTVSIDPQNNAVKIGTDNTIKIDSTNNTVKIDGTSPVSVRDGDNPARRAFQTNTVFIIGDNEQAQSETFLVPGNKRMVIEYVSADILVSAGQLPKVFVSTTVNGVSTIHYANSNRLGAYGNGDDEFLVGQPLTLYADPGTEVQVTFWRNVFTGFGQCAVSLSGHYVDVP
jgi:hypothetical protein